MSMLSLCVHYNLYGGDTNKRSPHEHSRPSPNELRFSSQSETLNLPIIIFLQIDPISNSNNRTRRNVRNKIIAIIPSKRCWRHDTPSISTYYYYYCWSSFNLKALSSKNEQLFYVAAFWLFWLCGRLKGRG